MARNRFYKEVTVEIVPDGDQPSHRVLLDGKPINTPGGAVLALPSNALAGAIAEEWRAQDKVIRPETMAFIKLANTAIDRVAPDPLSAREQLLAFAHSDVICYRAPSPADLTRRQELGWDPLLMWARERYGASLRAATGFGFIEQDKDALDALGAVVSKLDSFSLAALYAAAQLCGSLVIALALFERRLDSEGAFAAANLDKIYQAERWGWDQQESAKAAAERAELNQISLFFDALRK